MNKTTYQSAYDRVVSRILEELQNGVIPWRLPYLGSVGLPTNFITKKRYRGINTILLSLSAWQSNFFLTYKQAQELGGNVKKGETGSFVIKVGTHTKTTEDGRESYHFLKGYTVFNLSQCENIPLPEDLSAHIPSRGSQPVEAAEQIIAQMPNPPTLSFGDYPVATYQPSIDQVNMPFQHHFTDNDSYYHTFFHELAHSCAHTKRLNLKFNSNAKSLRYAEEELFAEITSTFVCAATGIIPPDIQNSSAYIAHWLEALSSKDHQKWIIRAASAATKASDYILNTSTTDENTPHETANHDTLQNHHA